MGELQLRCCSLEISEVREMARKGPARGSREVGLRQACILRFEKCR